MKINGLLQYLVVIMAVTALVRGTINDVDSNTTDEEVIEEDLIAEEEEVAKNEKSSEVESLDELDMSAFENKDDILEAGEECSRISPKEIFYTEIHPRFLDLFDEMSHFVESVMARIESALITLLPHVQESPIGNIKVDELFPEVRRFMFGTMRDVYDLVRASWRHLIRTHVQEPDNVSAQLEALKFVRDAQKQGEESIRASLMELSVTLKAIVLNSIHVVQDSLTLPKNTKESEAAMAIAKSLPRVAPNFLGTLMMKIMEKGADPEAYKKILTNTLRDITGPVEQMYEELEAIVAEGDDPEVLPKYWKKMMDECHSRLIKDPLYKSNYEVIFRNEEYLTSLVLGLMATF